MPIDLHFVCPEGRNHKSLNGKEYESGNWVVSNRTAQESIGGRIYLHKSQRTEAWHGGTITKWREHKENPRRKIFTYVLDEDHRVSCLEGWGQEKAIIRRQ